MRFTVISRHIWNTNQTTHGSYLCQVKFDPSIDLSSPEFSTILRQLHIKEDGMFVVRATSSPKGEDSYDEKVGRRVVDIKIHRKIFTKMVQLNGAIEHILMCKLRSDSGKYLTALANEVGEFERYC